MARTRSPSPRCRPSLLLPVMILALVAAVALLLPGADAAVAPRGCLDGGEVHELDGASYCCPANFMLYFDTLYFSPRCARCGAGSAGANVCSDRWAQCCPADTSCAIVGNTQFVCNWLPGKEQPFQQLVQFMNGFTDPTPSLPALPSCSSSSGGGAQSNCTAHADGVSLNCACPETSGLVVAAGTFAHQPGAFTSQISFCLAGAYCAGGSSDPQPCPVGSVCPEGSADPRPCTDAEFCRSASMSAPSSLCPAGRNCVGWVRPANWASLSDVELGALAPLCPAGFACAVGTVDPLPCTLGSYCPAGTAPREEPELYRYCDASRCYEWPAAVGQFPLPGYYAPRAGMAEPEPCPAGTYDERPLVARPTHSIEHEQCTGRCGHAAFLWQSGQTHCVISAGAIALFVCMGLLFTLLVARVGVVVWRRLRVKSVAREEKEHAALVAKAISLAQRVRQMRDEVASRLARDAAQAVAATPLHGPLMAQLTAAGRLPLALAQFEQLLLCALRTALVDCELKQACRLLSTMVLNPARLPPPALHNYCRAAVVAAATYGFPAFAAPLLEAGAEPQAEAAAIDSAPLLEVGAEPREDAAAIESQAAVDVSAAVQRECAQFAAAWLPSAVALDAARPLAVRPPLAKLRRLAPGQWSEAALRGNADEAAASVGKAADSADEQSSVAVPVGAGAVIIHMHSPSVPPSHELGGADSAAAPAEAAGASSKQSPSHVALPPKPSPAEVELSTLPSLPPSPSPSLALPSVDGTTAVFPVAAGGSGAASVAAASSSLHSQLGAELPQEDQASEV